MKWILIKDGIVQNVIVPPIDENVQAYRDAIAHTVDEIKEVQDDERVESGWSYDGKNYIPSVDPIQNIDKIDIIQEEINAINTKIQAESIANQIIVAKS